MMENENMNEFNLPEFPTEFDTKDFEFSPESMNVETRIIKPKIHTRKKLCVKYAEELANKITVEKNSSTFVFLGGRFVFGDFIHSFIIKNNIHVLKMHIATLSMSPENVASLHELMAREFIDSLDLHVSIYFYAHERHVIMPLIYQALDMDNRFQLTVSATHAKICLIKTEGGKNIVIHGSANLRSSDNIEQVEIIENEELYEFNRSFLDSLTERYKTINKPVRGEAIPWPE